MKESVFSKQLRDSIAVEFPKAHINLIQDSYRSGKKPYDFYFVLDGEFYSVECKVANGKSINFDCVLPHQAEKMDEVALADGFSFLAVCVPGHQKNFAFVFSNMNFKQLKKMAGYPTIKIKELIRNRQGIWLYRKKISGILRWDVVGLDSVDHMDDETVGWL